MMIICHLCLCGTYNEEWNYQENILPKYHVKMGFDVYQIVTPYVMKCGAAVRSASKRYVNKNGVNVIRLNRKNISLSGKHFFIYPSLSAELEAICPDIIFIHDCQFMDIRTVAKYAKNHKDTAIYVDNHADLLNSASNWFSKYVLHKIIWRCYAQMICPYVKKFYGVLPARVDFLTDLYGLPEKKCGLLVMGADDELVKEAVKPGVRNKVRNDFGITENNFLIVTGGKINSFRPEVLCLMKAVAGLRKKMYIL